ncbi:ATP-binding cassette domain-containing protein [Rhodococcus sp. PSBB049]|uniref:ATP-binding cassette domain-containing protein n=1 Tax=Rhodococcus sp. PSBB049 TaxID=2812863 RepID=UPI00197D4B5E|nr:ATP-binding cassette domain-containing protein [Rhodococcus sp. PSBB049]QSE71201.1 ATP-binding cassette domain-containing protein [Rhodococcus sp. PSBB049]
MSPSTPAVLVDAVTKSFGPVPALCGVSFTAEAGEVLGVLGPNGAGKTTTVNILSTLLRPDSGRAVVAGHDVVADAAGVRRTVMLTGQYAALDDMLTGFENLVLFARLLGLRRRAARARARELLAEFDLEDAADRRVGKYSGGMRRRIDIACGLVVPPQVVFLDEPTTGLDPRSRQRVWDLIAGFKSQGVTTLLTTQYLEEADLLADRIVVIDRGTVVAEGTPAQLKQRVGATFCEVVPVRVADVPAVAHVLGRFAPAAAIEVAADRVTIPAPHGAGTLAQVATAVAAHGVAVSDIALRRPSLDEVFLALTAARPRFEVVA